MVSLLSLFCSPALALQPTLSGEALFTDADAVVVAEVTSAEVRWAAAPSSGLQTEVWLAPLEVWKGVPPGSLVLPGGRDGIHQTWVEDVPGLQVDRRYLLALVETPEGWVVLGGEQGAIALDPLLAWEVNSRDWTDDAAPVEEPFELNVGSFSGIATTAEVVDAYQQGIAAWNVESGADLYLSFGGPTNVSGQGGGNDDHNVAVYGGSNNFGSGIAVATTTSSSGFLTDCDIQFWSRNLYGTIDWHFGVNTAPSGRMDFRHTAVHELGHCLGMAHSSDSGAIMYGSNSSGTGDERRHLTPDDIAGIQYLYGDVAPDLVVEDVVLTDEDGDGELVNNESFTVAFSVVNVGDGSAYDVMAQLSAGQGTKSFEIPSDWVSLGRLGADTPVGRVVGADIQGVSFPLTSACPAEVAGLELVLEDARGVTWSLPLAGTLPCADAPAEVDPKGDDAVDPVEDEPGGCGCTSTPVGAAWTPLLLLTLLVGGRKREIRETTPGDAAT